MTQDSKLHLSRRKILVGLGTVGVAAAGAGLGTSAYFNDTEQFENNVLTAGELNLLVDYYTYWDQGSHGSGSRFGTVDGTTVSGVLDDVKPGDSGLLAFCFEIVDNPAYLWAGGELTANHENGQPEPEADESSDNSGGDPGEWEGELAQSIDVVVRYCDLVDDIGDEFTPVDISTAGPVVFDGTLAEYLDLASFGVPLDSAGSAGVLTPGQQSCFAPATAEQDANPCLCLEWNVPEDVGNEIQTDSLAFDLQFYAEQCRHNDGTRNPYATGTGFSSISFEKSLNMQALAQGGSGRGEIQIHGDSGGVEDTNVFGTGMFPANTDVGFTAEIDPVAKTASLTVNGVTVTDTDVTDGAANGAPTADPEWPGGVPSTLDLALNAYSMSGNGVTTVVEDVSVNGSPSQQSISSSGGNAYLAIPGVDATGTVVVTGTMRFEGSQSNYSTQDWMGIDFR